MKRTIRLAGLAGLAVTAVLLAGCDDDPAGAGGPLAPGSDFESRLIGREVVQVDRKGLPAVNTAFVSASADKNAFNAGAPADDEAAFSATLASVISARYGLTAEQAAALADFVLPDVLPLGDLSGFPNGRRLADDVIDVALGLIFGVFGPAVPALQSDGVDGNDAAFTAAFPYLAPPQS